MMIKRRFKKKRLQQQGPNRHRTSKHRTFTKNGTFFLRFWSILRWIQFLG